MPKRIPPIPVPPGQHYCFVCETAKPSDDFYRNRGKPTSPCIGCVKTRPQRQAAFVALMEQAREEVRAILAARPPAPPPVERVYAPMSGLARWLDREQAKKQRKPRRKPTATQATPR